MQWLIDIIKEVIHGQLGYFDRGDPPADDFSLPDFVVAGGWRDLDLSAIVPANSKLILFHCQATCGQVNKQIRFRQNGNANVFNVSGLRSQLSGISNRQDLLCSPDVNRVIEYNIQAGTWTVINLVVRGWWLR